MKPYCSFSKHISRSPTFQVEMQGDIETEQPVAEGQVDNVNADKGDRSQMKLDGTLTAKNDQPSTSKTPNRKAAAEQSAYVMTDRGKVTLEVCTYFGSSVVLTSIIYIVQI